MKMGQTIRCSYHGCRHLCLYIGVWLHQVDLFLLPISLDLLEQELAPSELSQPYINLALKSRQWSQLQGKDPRCAQQDSQLLLASCFLFLGVTVQPEIVGFPNLCLALQKHLEHSPMELVMKASLTRHPLAQSKMAYQKYYPIHYF